MADDRYFTDFDQLAISYINDGKDAADIYMRGPVIDLTHGDVDQTCTWQWKDVGPRTGLCFIKCKICGVNTQVVISGGSGSIKLSCNENSYVTPPTYTEESDAVQQPPIFPINPTLKR